MVGATFWGAKQRKKPQSLSSHVNALFSVRTRWKAIANAIGNVQAKILLTVVYFVVIPPFALVVKLFMDPLALRESRDTSYWRSRPAPGRSDLPGRRQY